MADSLAFWTKEKINTDLHFNLWKLPKKKNYFQSQKFKYFLDMGIKINLTDAISEGEYTIFNVFIPFKIKEDRFKDLSNILIKDENLLDAIFNKSLSCNSIESIPPYEVKDEDENLEFKILKLAKIWTFNSLEEGTHIEFSLSNSLLNEKKNLYIRFRVLLNEDNNFSEDIDEADSIIKSSYKSEELVEFRINELRNLPSQLQRNLRKEKNEIRLKQIHYFLVRSNDASLELSHEAYKRCRSVELDIWAEYIKDVGCNLTDSKRILSYHWVQKVKKDEEKIEHYGTFAKFSYTRNDTIPYFIAIFFIVSFLIEFASDYISSFWDKSISIALIDLPVLLFILGVVCLLLYALFKLLFPRIKWIYDRIKSGLKYLGKRICNFFK